MIVIDKPAGLVVHPAPGNPDGTLVNALLAHCGASLAGIGGVRRPGIVHRLDKDTSGVWSWPRPSLRTRALGRLRGARPGPRLPGGGLAACRAAARRDQGAIGRDPRDRKRMAVVTRARQGGAHPLSACCAVLATPR